MDFLATPHLWVLYDTPATRLHLNLNRATLSQGRNILLVGAIALVLSSPALNARTFPNAGTVYIAPPPGYNVNIRRGPGTQYPAMNTLRRGTAIAITGRYVNGWAELTDGSWVAGNLINSVPPAGGVFPRGGDGTVAYTAYIATPVGYNLNIRSGPGTQYPAVNTLSRGTAITITGRYVNGWAELTDGSWAAGNWIQVDRPVTTPTPTPPPSDSPRYLQLGSRGPEVTQLQQRLQTLQYLPANFIANGFFGEETEQAVRRFQRRNGLVVDGIAGPQTQQVLYSSSAIANSTSPDSGDTSKPDIPETVPPEPPAQGGEQEAQVATDDGLDALVFSGPGTEYDLLGFIANGTVVEITGRFDGNWAELSEGGWVYTDWLEF